MKNRISVSGIEGIIWIIYCVIIQNFASDCGMGLLGSAFCLTSFIYVFFTGGMRETISKMVSIRMHRGMYGNVKKIFKRSMIYILGTGVFLCIMSFLLGEVYCNFIFRSDYAGILLKLLCVVFFLYGITEVINGYYMGIGNSAPVYIGLMVRGVILFVAGPICMFFIKKYGLKVSALLNNELYTWLYVAIGACLVQIIAFVVSLLFLIVVFRRVTDHVSVNTKDHGLRKVESEKRLIRTLTGLRLKVASREILLFLVVLFTCFLYVKGFTKTNIILQDLFVHLGIIYGKLLLPIMFVLTIFKEYCISEKFRLHTEYTREEKRIMALRLQYMMKNTGFLLVPIVLILIVLAKPFVTCVFGGDVVITLKVFVFAMPLIFLFGLCMMLQNACIAIEYKKMTSFITCISVVVSAFSAVLLLKNANMLSLIINMYIFCVMFIAGHMIALLSFIALDWMDILSKYIKIIISGIAIVVLELILNHFVQMNLFLLLLSLVLGYFIYYICMIVLRGISKKDAQSIKGTITYIPVAFIAEKLGIW